MDTDSQVELARLVNVFVLLGAVHEETRHDAFADVCVLVVLVDAELFVVHVDLDSLHQRCKLVLHVSSSS